MKYIDGFVLVVPRENIEAYTEMARDGGELWKRHGALEYKECIGDDMTPDVPGYQGMRFPAMAGAREDETVVFSYIAFESREHRDAVNAKVMEEMSKNPDKYKDKPMPFDMKRMAYGGFKTIVDPFEK